LTLDTAGDVLSTVPPRRFPAVAYADRGRVPYIQPRGGVPVFEAQRALNQILDEAGSDFIPLTIDSYSRQNQYHIAAELLERSEEEQKNYLNGYPLVVHGCELTRELYTDLNKPVSLRHGTPDARLLVEVALASGIAEIEGGGLCYCLPYSEGFPIDRSLLYWQYVDRICAIHSAPEALVHRESFGPLTATMVPPAITVVVQVIEALLAAEQGVLSFAVSFGQTGSPIQDVATARVLRTLTRRYLNMFDFGDVRSYLVFHQWMGQFPTDRTMAGALIACSAQNAYLIGADKIVVKTVDEALGIPDPEVNADAIKSVRYVFDRFRWPESVTSPSIETEIELIESEAVSILEAIFRTRGSAFWESVYNAFQAGLIDVPYSPHSQNANLLVSMRDVNGSIRIKHPGNVPISECDAKREQSLLCSREGANDPDQTFRRLLTDISIMA
jgi:methylaspartate mutase epsilon subunit